MAALYSPGTLNKFSLLILEYMGERKENFYSDWGECSCFLDPLNFIYSSYFTRNFVHYRFRFQNDTFPVKMNGFQWSINYLVLTWFSAFLLWTASIVTMIWSQSFYRVMTGLSGQALVSLFFMLWKRLRPSIPIKIFRGKLKVFVLVEPIFAKTSTAFLKISLWRGFSKTPP